MTVTASVLYDLVNCPQRVALDAFGDKATRDPSNAFVKLLWERGSVFEKETIGNLKTPYLDLSALEGEEKERQTLDAMKRDEPLIYGGSIRAGDLVGVPDILRKELGGYVPGDIKSGRGEEGGGDDDSDGKPKLHYAVQLAIYVDLLEQIGFSAGRRGFIWDVSGDEVTYDFTKPQGPKKPGTLWDDYQSALALARGILSKQIVPKGAYASGCKLCHWYTHCINELTIADDLTLIPFLGRNLRDTMQDTIPTIAAFAACNPEAYITKSKTAFKGLGADRMRVFHSRAVLLKDPAPTPFLRSAVMLPSAETELFFDIEVDPLRDFCYLHGIVERNHGDNSAEKFVYFFAEKVTPEAERQAFADAYTYLTSRAGVAIYYYSKYERTIYRKLQRKFPDVCSEAEIEELFNPLKSIDLYFDVVFRATEWPTRDHSIKTLAKYLGFGWRDVHPSGAASIEWFDRWCRSGDRQVRQRILDYNEDDCRATRVLLDGIRAIDS
ncbi:MAG: TM0106 family RecB-like putative nuclease [Afipia sp.]|nr:TM0106 family RecB-like putative nuclease [Afipia sp.]